MMVAAVPLIDLVYRRGKFLFADTQTSAIYFFWFSLSLALWAAQGLYARAFYAAGDTLTPMAAVSVITAASLPVYSILFHTFGVVGLAWASDIGIGANLLALAWLLHYRKLVPLGEMRWGELGKAALTALVAGGISFEVAKVVPLTVSGHGSRMADLTQLALVTVTWAGAVAAGLWLLRSQLPGDLRRRKGAVYPAVAQGQSKEILGAGTQP
jgi:putative peptidoglycan lipid II flippase